MAGYLTELVSGTIEGYANANCHEKCIFTKLKFKWVIGFFFGLRTQNQARRSQWPLLLFRLDMAILLYLHFVHQTFIGHRTIN